MKKIIFQTMKGMRVKVNRGIRIMIIVFIIVAVLILIGAYVVGNYFYNLALNPKTDKSLVFDSPTNKNGDAQEDNENEKWLNVVGCKNETIKSEDELKLNGYVVEKENSNKWAILVHGYTGRAMQMSYQAERFYNMGFNVLFPDLRGHGKSEGNYIGMGWDDRRDIISWINYINSNYANQQIILYGVSMGAATVMMTSGEADLPNNVKAIIEDCGYTSIKDEFSYQLKAVFNLSSFPILNLASMVTKIRAGYFLADGSAIEQVKKSKTPIMFIHGDIDTFVPYYMLDQLYNSATCEKEKLVIEGAAHAKASDIGGETYWKAIEKFVDKYL